MINQDDVFVGIAAVAGLTNWMLNIDIVLQLAISVISLVYISLKVYEQIKKNKKDKEQ